MSADYTGIYFAHKKTVTKYRLSTGELIWAHHVRGGAAALIQSATEVSTGCVQAVYRLSTGCVQAEYRLSTCCVQAVYRL